MANLKEIRRRIISVKGTQKITSAMKMVAAAKLRRAQENTEKFRAYATLSSSILAEVAADSSSEDHPLLERREVKKSMVFLISSDRGLCGGFNSNLSRMVDAEMKAAEQLPALTIIGKKARAYFSRRDIEIFKFYADVYDDPSYAAAASIARQMASLYQSGEVDRIDLAYNEMISVANQSPTISPLLPIALPEKQDEQVEGLKPVGFIFEPNRKELLSTLLPKYLEVKIFGALLESMAAEHAARMTAMETATNNAQDMIDSLTLVYNRARQSAITNELMDIVGGAEALND